MTFLDSSNHFSKVVAASLKAAKPTATSVGSGIWHWLNGMADGIGHFLTNVFVPGFKGMMLGFEAGARALHDGASAMGHALAWLEQFVLDPLADRLEKAIHTVSARERRDYRYLVRLIYVTSRTVMAYAFRLVGNERRARVKAVRHAEALAKLEVRHLHMTIEREAASGYTLDRAARTYLVVRLLEFAGARNPIVRTLVGDIAKGLIDLLSVEDPILRIGLAFLIKHVIDKLGIERPLGHLISDLMAPILGDPKPHDLHDVIADVCKRLDAIEAQWATFFTDGGSEVEQAGRQWQAITSLVTSAAIVGFTAQAVADPHGWSSEIQSVIGTPANDLVTAAARLFKG